jgi:hypothetical protein
MDIDTAAEYFPELAKLEERMQAQTEAAIREYERNSIDIYFTKNMQF